MTNNLPLKHPKPNAQEFIGILTGKLYAKAPPLIEYLVDERVMKPIVTDLFGKEWFPYVSDRGSQQKHLDMFVDFWHRLGYDIVRFEKGLDFQERHLVAADTAAGSAGDRSWADEHRGIIMSWQDFEQYRWPRIEDVDFYPFEYIDSHLPDGMGLVTCHAAGIFEHLSWIMSYEGLSLALHDEPDLVQAVSEKIGELLLAFYRQLLDLDNVVAIFPGDDMGFKTGTLISPDALRTYCLPWHKRTADLVHGKGLPYFLHSCGNLHAIMEDLIEDVGIDGKHSYEDTIIPVERFQEEYGQRIAILGGIDINILSIGTEDDIRKRTRGLMESCGARGRYAVGSGNSIPSYVPVENYLAMVDEAVKIRF